MVVGAFPLEWELANGNLTLVTLALALLAWRSRPGWRAATPLAFAMGLKLLAAPVALTLMVAGRWRLLALTGALLAAVVLVTWPFLGGAWSDWIRLSFELAAGPPTLTYNIVPGPLRAGMGRALLLGGALVALVVIGAFVRARRLSPALGFSAALAAAPYVSAFVLYPYAVLALPVVVWISLGRVAVSARLAGLAAWLLIDLQALATMDVTKAVRLVKQLGGDILGVVENMAYVAMPDGSRNEVFGPSQGLKLVIAANAPLMARIPIDPEISRLADAGGIEQYVAPEFEELMANFLSVAQKTPQPV